MSEKRIPATLPGLLRSGASVRWGSRDDSTGRVIGIYYNRDGDTVVPSRVILANTEKVWTRQAKGLWMDTCDAATARAIQSWLRSKGYICRHDVGTAESPSRESWEEIRRYINGAL